ncbi:MAG: hypothetical protein ACXITV_11805 [Luteibaculaceae bacterium]
MNKAALTALSLVALAVAIFSLFEIKNLRDKITDLQNEEEVELHVSMAYLQRYMDKLYFAGKAENVKLVKYYIHELEEILEELAEADPEYDGIELGNLIKQYGISALESLEEKLESGDSTQFSNAYKLLVGACNSCHGASNKGFIVIKEPEYPAYSNQVYTKP